MASTDSPDRSAPDSSAASLLLGALSTQRAILYTVLSAVVTGILLFLQGTPVYIACLAGGSYAFLVVNAAIDSQTKKLVPLWTHCAGALCLIACGIFVVQGQAVNVMIALVLAVLLSAAAALISRACPSALGAGDARIIAVLAAWVALRDPISLIGMFIIAGTAQLGAFGIVNAQRRGMRGEGASLPFAPSLVIGSWFALMMAFAGHF